MYTVTAQRSDPYHGRESRDGPHTSPGTEKSKHQADRDAHAPTNIQTPRMAFQVT